jgi:predicted outer membrane repeat protein
VTSTKFQRNTASSNGGGIYAAGDHLTLQNDTVSSNGAPPGGGGGIYNDSGAGGVSLVGQNFIFQNLGGNCAPAGSVDGCVG